MRKSRDTNTQHPQTTTGTLRHIKADNQQAEMISRTLRAAGRTSCIFTAQNFRPFSVSPYFRDPNPKQNNNPTESQGSLERSKLSPHITNTTFTVRPDSDTPSVDAFNTPPEFLSAVDPNFNPKDTQHLTGGTQKVLGGALGAQSSSCSSSSFSNQGTAQYLTDAEVVSQLHENFTIPPLSRDHEDVPTTRARLLYQSRKRGILETDLLLSTFAHENLHQLTPEQLRDFDKFLDENDWDIYYWCTQQEPTPSAGRAGGAAEDLAAPAAAQEMDVPTETARNDLDTGTGGEKSGKMGKEGRPFLAAGMDTTGAGEWAQTVGKKKEPYRLPPEKWRNSEILMMIRRHVERKKASGSGSGAGMKVEGGLGRMPPVRQF